jgi:hypothetical protein
MLLCISLFAQEYKIPNTRTEKIIKGDTLMIFGVLLKSNDIKTQNDRLYHWFWKGEINKNQGGYSGNLLDGKFRKYLKTGELCNEGFFSGGLKNGAWKTWDRSGRLITEFRWKEGVRDGKQVLYGEDGLTIIERFRKGKKVGKTKRYRYGSKLKNAKVSKSKGHNLIGKKEKGDSKKKLVKTNKKKTSKKKAISKKNGKGLFGVLKGEIKDKGSKGKESKS